MHVRGSALAVLACVVLGACSGGEAAPEDVSAAATPTPTPTPDPTCPLTDLPIPEGVDVDRAAVAIKIENSPAARPQSGLDAADVVYEEVVEGGITRFMAIFHCGAHDQAGPVRSARFDDPKIAAPFTKVIGFSGANGIVLRELAARGVVALDENSGDAFFRDPPGVFETHNLFADTDGVRQLVPRKDRKPPTDDVFIFGEPNASAKKARSITINFNRSSTVEYRWKGGAWKRWEAGTPFLMAGGSQIGVPNVLIQEVRVDNSATIVDVAGNPSPDISLTGKGRAFLFRSGKVTKGYWRIDEEGGTPFFGTKGGEPLYFAPGPIWVELVPSQAGAVKGSFDFE